MRKFRSVNNAIRRTLECSFSTLTNPLNNKIPEDYTPYAISVFEGRLDEEQSEELLVNVSVSVDKERISKLNKFSIRLMSEFDAYSSSLQVSEKRIFCTKNSLLKMRKLSTSLKLTWVISKCYYLKLSLHIMKDMTIQIFFGLKEEMTIWLK